MLDDFPSVASRAVGRARCVPPVPPAHRRHVIHRRDGGSDGRSDLRLVHAECDRRHHAGDHERAKKA
ncbi:HNH endonuclease [Streptomyces rishiriensis]|uniref:HNH endonuclease n=1 Tax=Streptomyces rishiriensis TaxID=68264 RepID=UPI000D59A23E|nr:HNH endonuclease [Streptomyces rishiriensis]